jgi:transcriptional regulator with XRE-family HTH domain
MSKKKTGEPPLIKQLRDEIQNSGQSLNQLARNAGVEPAQLSRFVRGERTLTLPAVAKVCQALGLELTRTKPAAPSGEKSARKPRGK